MNEDGETIVDLFVRAHREAERRRHDEEYLRRDNIRNLAGAALVECYEPDYAADFGFIEWSDKLDAPVYGVLRPPDRFGARTFYTGWGVTFRQETRKSVQYPTRRMYVAVWNGNEWRSEQAWLAADLDGLHRAMTRAGVIEIAA